MWRSLFVISNDASHSRDHSRWRCLERDTGKIMLLYVLFQTLPFDSLFGSLFSLVFIAVWIYFNRLQNTGLLELNYFVLELTCHRAHKQNKYPYASFVYTSSTLPESFDWFNRIISNIYMVSQQPHYTMWRTGVCSVLFTYQTNRNIKRTKSDMEKL